MLERIPQDQDPTAGRGYPGNGRQAVISWFGPPPLVARMISALGTVYGRAMDWHSRGWRADDPGDAYSGRAWRGYEPALQKFRGAMITPSAANIRGGLNQLLPGTTSLPNDAVAAPGMVLPAANAHDLLPGAPPA